MAVFSGYVIIIIHADILEYVLFNIIDVDLHNNNIQISTKVLALYSNLVVL